MKEIVTYLNFDGNTLQAMEFYKKCFDADLQVTKFSEIPGDLPKEVKDAKDRTMHARLSKGGVSLLMASDTMPGKPSHTGNNFSVSVHCDTLPEIDQLFAALSEKGKITMPLNDAFWGARFGMLTDQFGINWMLNFELPKRG